MKITIVEKEVNMLSPITLTRPAFDILIGGYTLYQLLKDYFPNIPINFRVRKEMENITNKKFKNISFNDGIEIDARTIPSIKNMKKIEEGKINELELIEFPHQIIILNKLICKENLELMSKKFEVLEKNVFIKPNVKIEKNVVFNCENGPIIIDDKAIIKPLTYIKGPVYIGKGTIINENSSIKDCSIIGDVCKIGGEIEESIIMNYSNKQHHGYLGNSVIGSWVNLGAGTSNSDLKNTYGFIKVIDGNNKTIQTKERFLGCVIGDQSKTSINTSIFTGKIIGVNSYLYNLVNENVSSFINYTKNIGINNSEFRLDKAIEIQKIIMNRRKLEQKKEEIDLLKNVFNVTKKERDMSLRAEGQE